MPIVRINSKPEGLSLHHAPSQLSTALDAVLDADGPVIVMIHGFKYRPSHRHSCPHRSIFATGSAHGATAWPRHIGFGLGRADEGLGIAFGWDARGHLPQVYRRAEAAGVQLAGLLRDIRRRAPHRPVHLLTHSMGSEVALRALPRLDADSVRRVVCLTGASFRSTARQAMTSTAGRTAELVNVTSRENDLFDWLFECLVPRGEPGDRAIGHGLEGRNIVTLQLDHPDHIEALVSLGSHLAPSSRRICHWSGYLRPGALRLWARTMREPEKLPLHLMAPTPPAPRWSRLMKFPVVSRLTSGARPAI